MKYFPSFFPGCSIKNRAKRLRVILRDMTERPFQLVKEQRACVVLFLLEFLALIHFGNFQDAGTASPSFVARMLSDYEQMRTIDLDHIQVMKEVSASLFRGMFLSSR